MKFIEFTGEKRGRANIALYLCDCGESIKKEFRKNRYDNVSCRSCSKGGRKSIHGDSHTHLHNTWSGMKARCSNVDLKQSKDYALKGIVVCDEWANSYESFREWAYDNGYKDTLTVDRIDNNKGYSPDNCRWTDKFTQSQNTRILRSTNTSGYRGVGFRGNIGKYEARIMSFGKQVNLGYHDTAEEAGLAYDMYVTKNNLEHTKNFNPSDYINRYFKRSA